MDREKKNIENQEHSFTAWVKKHKNGVLIAGGVIVAIGAGYTAYKNLDTITSIFKTTKPAPLVLNNPPASVKVALPIVDVIPAIPTEAASKIINNGEPFRVCGHPRNLPTGWNASAEKTALALEYGFKLDENQTWVENYLKNCA